jgi:glycosyltransferase involved in cell wall biosynthesis
MQFVLKSGVNPSRTAFFKLGNAIELCHFESPEKREVSHLNFLNLITVDTKILLCAFMIEKRKILEDAIDVAQIVKKEFNLKLIVAGEGTARPYYEEYVASKGMENDVIFIGNISQIELSSLMVRADVILSPLTGRALTEAVLSETPVVAYDIDCHPELIKTGVTGELVQFRNRAEMAARTAFILKHPEYGAQLGKAGRNFALKFMDPQTIIMEQIRIYQRLIT